MEKVDTIQMNSTSVQTAVISDTISDKSTEPSDLIVDNSRGVEILKDSQGHVVRAYEGIDMKDVYNRKPFAYKAVKRAFDIIASAVALVLLSPVFLILAIKIKKEDGGPVFFSGQRWGKDFIYFPMHKFRSMCVDAEARTNEVVGENEKNGMAFKVKDDPRITKTGRFMR